MRLASFRGSHGYGSDRTLAIEMVQPRHFALLHQVFENLFVFQSVHRAPESLVTKRQELVVLNQPLEWRLYEFISVPHVLEDLLAEDKEAAIDPQPGFRARDYSLHGSVRIHVHQMEAE